MSDFDISIDDQIERLHAEAEELGERAKIARTEQSEAYWRQQASAKVRQAARLRAQAGEDA